MANKSNHSKDSTVLQKRAAKLFDDSEYQEIISLLGATIEEHKKELNLNVFLAYSYYKLGDYKSAIPIFNQVLILKPNAENSIFLRAKCKENLPDFRGAEKDYRALLAVNPHAPDAHRRLGFISERHQNFGAAIWFYKKALEVYPKDLDAKDWLSKATNKLQVNLKSLPPHLRKLIGNKLIRTVPNAGTQSIIILQSSSGAKRQIQLKLSDWALVDTDKEIASSDKPTKRQVLHKVSEYSLQLDEYLGRELLNIHLFMDCNEAHFEFEGELVLEVIDITKIKLL